MATPEATRDIRGYLARLPGWAWFAVGVVLQLAIIGSLIAGHYATATTGTEVRLRIAPVDPRDPLRGDYLSFTYDISRLRRDSFKTAPKAGQTVYVPLSKGDRGVWGYAQYPIQTTLPARGGASGVPKDVVYIRGVVKNASPNAASGGGDVQITYGIEEYFVAEGKAAGFPTMRVLQAPQGEPVAVSAVAVGEDGAAVLKQVYVDGVPWP